MIIKLNSRRTVKSSGWVSSAFQHKEGVWRGELAESPHGQYECPRPELPLGIGGWILPVTCVHLQHSACCPAGCGRPSAALAHRAFNPLPLCGLTYAINSIVRVSNFHASM